MANSLLATVVVTFTATQTSVDFGALRGGDANDDNAVQLVNFSILRTTYGKCQGEPTYDGRADFNGDGCVLLVDFSILRMSFGTLGDAVRSSAEAATPAEPSVLLKAEPMTPEVAVGDVFSVPLRVDAGDATVNGAASYLTFDLAVVQVVTVTAGIALPDLLLSKFDNQTGTLRFAAGGLEQAANGVFDLANFELRAVWPGDAKLHLVQGSPAQSGVTAASVSVLATVVDAAVTVRAPEEAETTPSTLFLPMVGGRK